MEARIRRALSQRIFLIDTKENQTYEISGLTDCYTVKIRQEKHTCTCKDYERRQTHCKHIFFVLFRVLNISQDDWLVDQSLITGRVPRQLEEIDTECCICIEEFQEKDSCINCITCGHKFHILCINQWARHKKGSCPLCRSNI